MTDESLSVSTPEVDAEVDTWAWAREDAQENTVVPSSEHVLAIVVTRNGAAWLPAALAGLEAQTRRPERILVVDNGSDAETAAVIASAKKAQRIHGVVEGRPEWGFGAAVAAAVEADPRHADGWLWLLHDDAVAAPECLANLLVAVAQDPTIDVTGPKLLLPSRRAAGRQISELGVSIAESGERELALDPGEIDQGQHEASATLGVSTCGMLVRASTFASLGGFDPAVPLFRDGVEFGWRANLAGHRVVTTPSAVMTHRQVGRAGARPGVTGSPTVRDRAYGMLVVAAHHRGIGGPVAAIRLMLGSLLRALFYLLGKAPSRALDELRALRMFVGMTKPAHALRARINALGADAAARKRVAALRPRRLAWLVAAWGGLLVWLSDFWTDTFGPGSDDTTLDDLIGDDFAGGRGRTSRRPWALSLALVLLVVAFGSVVAGRKLLGLGHLASTRLLPAQDTLAALLRDYTSPIPGAPGQVPPPWLGFVGVGSVFTFGQPEWFVTVVFMAAVPAAALAAHLFLRRLANDRRTRLVGAIAYGLLPVLTGGVNRGDLGLVVTAVVLPLLGMAVLAWRRRGTGSVESWRGPFAVGLGLTILASFNPVVWLLGAAAGVAAAVRAGRIHAMRIGVALLVPLVLLSPWIPTLAAHPGRLLTGFDPTLDGVAPVSTLGLLVGRAPGIGLPPLWLSILFFATIWLLGLAGLYLRAHAARGWALLSLGGLATAVVVTRFLVTVPATDDRVRPAAGMFVIICFGALIALVVEGWDHIQARLATRAFGTLHVASLVALAVAIIASVAGLGWWMVGGETTGIHRTTMSNVPAFARQTQASGQGLRTLLVDLSDGRPVWTWLEGDGNRLGDTERGEAFGGDVAARERVADVVADLASGRPSQEVSTSLVQLGIGHVGVANASDEVLATVAALPGLAQVTADEHGRVWRVTAMRSRAMIVSGTDIVAIPENGARIETGPAERRLVLAEPVDARWRLTVDGHAVEPVTVEGDPRQWFALGSRAGEVRWELQGHAWWAWLQFVAFAAVCVLAAPALRRTQQRDPEAFARRAARLDSDEVTA